MSIKVFQTNANGKIELTRCELEKLLNEIYNEGYRAGENKTKGQYWTWTPNNSTNNKITTTNTTNITNAIDDLKSATEISDINSAKAVITTRRNNETPSTYAVDLGENFNLNSMTKALEEILRDHSKLSALKENTDPFISLAKELSGV
jgi:hypothetical protein